MTTNSEKHMWVLRMMNRINALLWAAARSEDPLAMIDPLLLKQTGDDSHRRFYFVLGDPIVYVEQSLDTGAWDIVASWLDAEEVHQYDADDEGEAKVIAMLSMIGHTRKATGDWSVLGEMLAA